VFRTLSRPHVLQESTGSLRGLVRQLSIDQFENEGRRVMGAESAIKAAPSDRTPIFERHSMDPGSIHKVRHLFQARHRPCWRM
jgi:protein phosphatase